MSGKSSPTFREYSYKAEMKRLLNLIVHSLYANPEIFLRELVSNASDALNKARFELLRSEEAIDKDAELRIDVNVDKENSLFEIVDTGIGMNSDELVEEIGAIASSGTMKYVEALEKSGKKPDAEMIGKFGVGFYSVFMVTDEVTIETRRIDHDSQGLRWRSLGEDKFTIEEIDRSNRGTRIYFSLKDDYQEFYDADKVKATLKKYSNFVDFPIYVNGEKVNTVQALWQKNKDEVKTEELNEFYKFISGDYQEPLESLHLNIEGAASFKALLFVPKTAPPQLFADSFDKTVHLYSSKVFIQDDCKELLPEYLRFVRGVVDTEDLPLNVSRETIQNSPLISKIRTVATGKLLDLFENMKKNDFDKYKEFFSQFGQLIKTGINSDFKNRDKIIDLLVFETSKTGDDERISFKEYVERAPEEQKEIYYLFGDRKEVISRNPNLEYFKKKDLEVIYLLEPADLFTIPYINEYDGKPLKSIDKKDVSISEDDKEEKPSEEMKNAVVKAFKDALKNKVEDVAASNRLVDSAVTLVASDQGLDPQMEKVMSMLDKGFSGSKKILEINLSHPLIKNVHSLIIEGGKEEKITKIAEQLYQGALLIEGNLSSPNEFVARMTEFLTEATSNK